MMSLFGCGLVDLNDCQRQCPGVTLTYICLAASVSCRKVLALVTFLGMVFHALLELYITIGLHMFATRIYPWQIL